MARGTSGLRPHKAPKIRDLKRILSGRALSREDSDDELGREDFQWEWIHPETSGCSSRSIIGARHGSGFECKIGDCVLLKAEGERKVWVGLICEFLDEEEDGEKMANFMWFSTESEIRNKEKKRRDYMANELYITPAWDVNPLNSINGSAKIYSATGFHSSYPDGQVPKQELEKAFVCRRACNTRTATYSDEFEWEDVFSGEEDLDKLIDLVQRETKPTRRKRLRPDEEWFQANTNAEDPSTPRKKMKYMERGAGKQPNLLTPSKLKTPTSKRIIAKRPLEFTPLGTRTLSHSMTPSSPFQLARTRLHVSSIPTALPCREDAFAAVYSQLEAAISEGAGSCIYISGTPGTGKTATVREVVAQLNAAVQEEEVDDFIFVEINGMKMTDPHQAYSLLWEALRGDRVSPVHALDLLEHEFSSPSPRRVPCVVLMDELDQLVTKNQSVMYNFFNWPGLRHSRLIVLAVANTMDLPERTLSNKISSRLGLTRITFPGYTHEQLMTIIQSRLEGVPGDIVDADAIQFASRKIAAVSGDARRALDICRRAVEIAETEDGRVAAFNTPTRGTTEASITSTGTRITGRVSIFTIKQAINEATSSPSQEYLRSAPLVSKIVLTSILARIRRNGTSEGTLGDIIDECGRIIQMSQELSIKTILTPQSTTLHQSSVSIAPVSRKTSRILAVVDATVELAEAGILGLETRKVERSARVRLLVSEDELRSALGEDREVRHLGVL